MTKGGHQHVAMTGSIRPALLLSQALLAQPYHTHMPALHCIVQAADRKTGKAQRAEARGVMRKVLKLLAGPLLEKNPEQAPRVLPLVLSTLLITQACGHKVAATAAKLASQVGSPLLASLRGLALPLEAGPVGTEAAKAHKGSKKAAAAVATAAAGDAAGVAGQQANAAAGAAYNARVISALGAHAASSQAAAEELSELLLSCSSSAVGCGAGRAEPLLLLVAHVSLRAGGQGAAKVAAALLQQLQDKHAAVELSGALPKECFDHDGVPTAALLSCFMGNQLSMPSMRSTLFLAALHAVPWDTLAPRSGQVCSTCPAPSPCPVYVQTPSQVSSVCLPDDS